MRDWGSVCACMHCKRDRLPLGAETFRDQNKFWRLPWTGTGSSLERYQFTKLKLLHTASARKKDSRRLSICYIYTDVTAHHVPVNSLTEILKVHMGLLMK